MSAWVGLGLEVRSMITPTMFKNVSFSVQEGIGPLPLSMVLLNRIGGEGTGNTTYTAGYAWHFTCDLQPSRSGKYLK